MLKHEDWPGLAKIATLRARSAAGAMRRISILCGNGGLFLPEEMARGADGAMTGFCYPEMMVGVVAASEAGDRERAHDIFDAYLPLARYEQQQGVGLAGRKYVLAKRGVIACDRLRAPGPRLSPADVADVERLLARQARRLAEIGAAPALTAALLRAGEGRHHRRRRLDGDAAGERRRTGPYRGGQRFGRDRRRGPLRRAPSLPPSSPPSQRLGRCRRRAPGRGCRSDGP